MKARKKLIRTSPVFNEGMICTFLRLERLPYFREHYTIAPASSVILPALVIT